MKAHDVVEHPREGIGVRAGCPVVDAMSWYGYTVPSASHGHGILGHLATMTLRNANP